jgi:hypothetical protein
LAPLLCKQLILPTTRLVRFQRQTGIFRWHRPVVYFLSLQCFVKPQTQHYRYNILTDYSTPLYISAVHITQLSLPTNSCVRILWNIDNSYCEKECIRKLLRTIRCIG